MTKINDKTDDNENTIDDIIVITPEDYFEAYNDFSLICSQFQKEMGGHRVSSLGLSIYGNKNYGDIIRIIGKEKVYSGLLFKLLIQRCDVETGELLNNKEIAYVRNMNQIIENCYYEEAADK
jgi:hypothetical protein